MKISSESPSLKQTDKRQAIKEQICAWICEQGLTRGEKILSQNRLAKVFEVTPLTVHRALAELQEEGIIRRDQGRGTFVERVPQAREGVDQQDVCLVLPDEGLDRPENNPQAWAYVQRLFRVFLECLQNRGTFSTAKALPGEIDEETCQRLARYDVVFFLGIELYRELVQRLIELEGPRVVVMGPRLSEVPCLTVDQDRVEGVRRGISHLITLGHRRIAYVGTDGEVGHLSYAGYSAVLQTAGLQAPQRCVCRALPAEQAVARLAKNLNACDAVFVDNDPLALQIIDLLRQRGVRIPEDLSVMGYDGLDSAVQQPPYLSSVRVPFSEMIQYALTHPAAAMEGEPPHASFAGEVLDGLTCQERT